MKNHPKNLKLLELQENELTEVFNTVAVGKNRFDFFSLKFINISRNLIATLPSTLSYPDLEILDASYNKFSGIPRYLGVQAPVLKVLQLKGNPIKTIQFNTKISVHFLDLSELPLLTEFDANVFNVIGLNGFP